MLIGTKTFCLVFGTEIIQSGKGRTKDYCSEPCKNFNKFLNACEDSFLKINNITPDNKKLLRSKFWSMANVLNSK